MTPAVAPAPSACTSTWTCPTTRRACRVIDGLRPWLPLLTALTSNSPYASGRDTGYASWRQQVWTRWPTAGTAEPYGTLAEYRRVRDTLIRVGAALDDGMLYYDARLSAAYPTVEIRVSDTCTDVDDAVLAAALARALVETVAETDRPGRARPQRPAARRLVACGALRPDRRPRPSGVVGPGAGRRRPRERWPTPWAPALEAAGDTDLVDDGLSRLATRGPGARRQRQAFERSGDLRDVVADLVARTAEAAAA